MSAGAHKPRVPAVAGWFTADAEPALLGSRCSACGSTFFPPVATSCRNPACGAGELAVTRLGRTGTLWSFTNACYPPPPPFVAADPFVPLCIGAVEIEPEKLVVLGQMARGVEVADLAVGARVELVVEPLYEDDDTEYVVWKWRPA
jgi:uncharacterized OB-fold protein